MRDPIPGDRGLLAKESDVFCSHSSFSRPCAYTYVHLLMEEASCAAHYVARAKAGAKQGGTAAALIWMDGRMLDGLESKTMTILYVAMLSQICYGGSLYARDCSINHMTASTRLVGTV